MKCRELVKSWLSKDGAARFRSASRRIGSNKRHLRADGLSLLPSALRPRLLGRVGVNLVETEHRLAADFKDIVCRRCVKFGLRFEVLGAVIASLVFSFVLQNSYASAASITLTVPSSALSVNLNPSVDNGFAKSSGATVKVSTDGHWGYELSVKAKDDNSLKNGSNKFTSISSSISESTFKSGSYNNQWGFLPSKLNGSANTNFVAAPTTSPTIIEKTSSSNDVPTPYTFAIGAKTNGTLPTGKYSNTFTFTAVANKVTYSITYNLNSGAWPSGNSVSNIQNATTTEASVSVTSVVPTRTDYSFEGWCSTSVTNNSTESPTCSGITYKSGSLTYTLSNDTNNLNLYAIWKSTEPPLVNKGDLGSMQSFSCSSKLPTVNNYGTVTDSRDSTKYKVAKLKDGKCWMVENLRIVGRSISSSNSDMSSGSFTIPASNLTTFKTSYSTVNNSAAYVDSTYGGYYTWYTATAGTGSSSITSDGTNATSSICPKGWKLPTSYASDSDFQKLVDAYGGNNSTGSTNLRKETVPGFTYAGYVYSSTGSLDPQVLGGYWSSTALSSTNAYLLYLGSSFAAPSTNRGRVDGYSVRCLARE